MSSCAKRTRKEKYELLTKATKLELQFFVCLADLHFQISYINAIILPTWNNNYLASVCTCIYMIKSETFLFFLCMFHIQLLPWHHSIPCTFGDIWTLSCETLYPLIYIRLKILRKSITPKHQKRVYGFLPKLLFLREVFRSDARGMALYLRAIYKGWFEAAPLYFFCSYLPNKVLQLCILRPMVTGSYSVCFLFILH